MLSLRPVQAMVLFVLAVLLICVVIVHANANVTSKEGDFSGAFWKISTGKYKWGACGADSWHRVFIDNDSRFNVIPILTDYIALAVLSKYGNEVIFAIAAFGYFPRIWLNCCCICSNV